ncbi:aminopeptidase 2 [Naviculisporaceae sp. PSN 640]
MATRLPRNVTPTDYDVFLDLDLDNLTFEGRVTIGIKALVDNTTSVVLHCKDLEILETRLVFDYLPGPLGLEVHDRPEELEIQHNKDQSTITVSFPFCRLWAGRTFKLQHRFRGTIKRNGRTPGLQWENYTTSRDGEIKKAIYTTCEPIGARTIFPCFDEPQLKASIKLSVKVNKKGVTILSNGSEDLSSKSAENGNAQDDNITRATFNPMRRMSTYLFVLVVGEFDYIEPFDSPLRFPVRVYALKGAEIHRGRRILDVAVKALSHYERLFSAYYPLDKLDLVAFPGAGGLENWGCVVFGERFVLLDEQETSAKSWQSAVETLCHELAHQWFGNLVTMAWWDDLWLSEAFAQWAGFYVVDQMFPDWGYWVHFVAADPDPEAMAFYQGALDLDSSRRGSHPLYNPDASPDKFHELFDNITYMKGATVLRMLYQRIGHQHFLRGIWEYLTRHWGGNATHEDLWKALERASPPRIDIRRYMDKWTKQVGYPLVVVYDPPPQSGIYDPGCNFPTASLMQHRYLQSSEMKDDHQDSYPVVLRPPTGHWYDGISCCEEQKQQERDTVLFTTHVKSRHLLTTKLNPDQVGLYRVSYPRHMLEWFQSVRDSHASLSSADIVGLISDHLALVSCLSRNTILPYNNQITTADLLDLMLAFSKSPRSKPSTSSDDGDQTSEPTTFLVWRQVFATVAKLKQAFLFAPSSERILAGLQRFHRQLVDFNPEKTPIPIQISSALFFSQASIHPSHPAHQIAIDLFDASISDPRENALNPNIRKYVFQAVSRSSTSSSSARFDAIFELALSTPSPEIRTDAFVSLGYCPDIELLQKAMALLTNADMPFSWLERWFFLNALQRQENYQKPPKTGSQISWTWLKRNWEEVTTGKTKVKPGIIGMYLTSCVSCFSTQDQLRELLTRYLKKQEKYLKTFEDAIDGIRARRVWVKRDHKLVQKWLAKNGF